MATHQCLQEEAIRKLESQVDKMYSVIHKIDVVDRMESKLDSISQKLGDGNVDFAVIKTRLGRVEWFVYGFIGSGVGGALLLWIIPALGRMIGGRP